MSHPYSGRIKWGWKPDPEDKRDFLYQVRGPVDIPKSIDFRVNCSPVENQGDLGSCTANASAGALEFLLWAMNHKVDLSRLAIYYWSRKIEGTVDQDTGAYLRDVIKVLTKIGAPLESLWPYDINKFTIEPPDPVKKDAGLHRVTLYSRVQSLQDAKVALSRRHPVVFGIPVYSAFEGSVVATTGIVPDPTENESPLGGHAMMLAGYEDDESWAGGGFFWVRNSWGQKWGIGGYCKISYAYFAKYAGDMWAIQTVDFKAAA